MPTLQGKRVLVTGAQQGIGRAIAIAAAAAGADVAINYLDDAAQAQDVAKEVERLGRRAIIIQADIGDVQAAYAMVTETAAAFGGIDVLVNNAGIFPRSEALYLEEAEWDRVLGVNLKGSFFCAQAAARQMLAQNTGGAIVNLSSITVRGTLNGAHYVATKGGIATMTKALALEWTPLGIRVNAVAPGIIDTAQPRYGMTEPEIEDAGRATPLGRIGRPPEIAALVVFLASDAASLMTGQTVHANGGAFMP